LDGINIFGAAAELRQAIAKGREIEAKANALRAKQNLPPLPEGPGFWSVFGEASLTGLGHALAIGGNKITFGQIAPLDKHVHELIAQNPSYKTSDAAFGVAREAVLAIVGAKLNGVVQNPAGHSAATVMTAKVCAPAMFVRDLYFTVESAQAAIIALQNGDVFSALTNGVSAVLGGTGAAYTGAATFQIARAARIAQLETQIARHQWMYEWLRDHGASEQAQAHIQDALRLARRVQRLRGGS